MMFLGYDDKYLSAESQVDFSGDNSALGKDFVAHAGGGNSGAPGQVFEVDSFGFGVEQIVTIGSQSSGAGAGKVTFNEFTIDRKIDISSPVLYKNCCSGKSFKRVTLGFRKAGGGTTSGGFFLRFDFKLVAVKTISWSHDDESPKESMAFMYGGLYMQYAQQNPNGQFYTAIPAGWNRVKNMEDPNLQTDIT
jgi:type VI secretion system Hcp family effector